MDRGTALAIIAYLIWGFMALYWIQVDVVSPQDLIVHRIVWAFPILLVSLIYMGRLRAAASPSK